MFSAFTFLLFVFAVLFAALYLGGDVVSFLVIGPINLSQTGLKISITAWDDLSPHFPTVWKL